MVTELINIAFLFGHNMTSLMTWS